MRSIFSSIKKTKRKMYESVHDLPLDLAIDIIVNSKVERLVLSGKFEYPELVDQWNKIYSEYIELLEDENQKAIHKAIKDIYVWNFKFERVTLLVNLLGEFYHKEIAQELKRLGYNVELNPEKGLDLYYRNLNSIFNQAKTLLVQIKNREKDLERLKSKNASGVKQTEADFQEILITLSQFYGYHIKAKDITLGAFALMIKRMKKHIENQENNLKNGRTNPEHSIARSTSSGR